jgi:hypothetical protein
MLAAITLETNCKLMLSRGKVEALNRNGKG